MAYTIQKMCFMAFRKSNYLNGRWGWSNDEALSRTSNTLKAEFCDPTSGSCVVSGEVDVRDADKNSTLVGTSNLFMKCHDELENHKFLHDHGTVTLSM